MDGPAKDVGYALAWVVWIVFAAEAAIMLTVTPERGAWARHHWLELAVLVVAWPLWAKAAHDLLELELLPVVTLLQAAKLAKLAKAVRVLRRRAPQTAATGAAALVLLVAVAVAVRVLATG
ncbi:MAG TPA: hypothetical protein VGI54_07900 [Solirubrobacteraceae bacterium]